MGTAVFWGMLVATGLGVFLIPGNYAFIAGFGRGRTARTQASGAPAAVPAAAGEAH
jgi:hypothetical protein